MNIIDFLNLHDIKWEPIKLKISKDPKKTTKLKKVPIQHQGYLALQTDFADLPEEEIKRRQELIPHFEHIAIDTSVIYQIDIDDDKRLPQFEHLLETCPYYKSVTKGLPHIFVKSSKQFPNQRTDYFDKTVDLLTGQWGWASKNVEVFNPENLIEPDISFLKKEESKKQRKPRKTSNNQSPKITVATNPLLFNTPEPDQWDEVVHLIHKLPEERAEGYTSWLHVGFAIHAIDNTDRGFQLFKEFSQKCPAQFHQSEWNIPSGERYRWWKNNLYQENHVFDINSLRRWASVITIKDLLGEFTHANVSEFFHEYNQLSIKYCSNDDLWYIVESSTWSSYKDPLPLYLKLRSYIKQKIIDHRIHLSEQVEQQYKSLENNAETITKEEKKQIQDDIAKLQTSMKSCGNHLHALGSQQFQSNCIKQLRGLYQHFKFGETLNEKHHLLAFEGGKVFDFQLNQIRDISPEDYISKDMTCGLEFVDTDETIQNEIKNWIRDMMLNEEEYEYLMDILAYIIHGGNWLSLFFIFTGSGANGKSVIGNLLTGALGSYFKTMNPKSITTQKTRPNETSDWVNTKGKRCVLFSEPDDKDKIQSDVFKIITGNDEITERALYKESVTFTPQFTPILLCNVIPELSKKDGGVERRLHCVDFPFKFMEDEKYDPNNPIHKKRNTEVLQKSKYDKNYHIQFLLILIHRFCEKNMKHYTQLIAPDRQKKCTNEYYNSGEEKLQEFLDKYYIYKEEDIPSKHKKKNWSIAKTTLLTDYTNYGGKISSQDLEKQLKTKNIEIIKYDGIYCYYPIQAIIVDDEPDSDECKIVDV